MFAAWLQDADARACYGLTMAPDIFGSATWAADAADFPQLIMILSKQMERAP